MERSPLTVSFRSNFRLLDKKVLLHPATKPERKPQNMENLLLPAIVCTLTTFCPVAARAGNIENTSGVASEPLRTAVSPKLYKSLCKTNIAGWVGVRGRLVGNHLTGPKVVHTDLNGAYDALALKLAGLWEMKGSNPPLGTYLPYTAMCYLLIYQLKDARMAVSYVNVDSAGGNQMAHYGQAWVAIEENGKWKEITAPTK